MMWDVSVQTSRLCSAFRRPSTPIEILGCGTQPVLLDHNRHPRVGEDQLDFDRPVWMLAMCGKRDKATPAQLLREYPTCPADGWTGFSSMFGTRLYRGPVESPEADEEAEQLAF